jgi:hypothetical protein
MPGKSIRRVVAIVAMGGMLLAGFLVIMAPWYGLGGLLYGELWYSDGDLLILLRPDIIWGKIRAVVFATPTVLTHDEVFRMHGPWSGNLVLMDFSRDQVMVLDVPEIELERYWERIKDPYTNSKDELILLGARLNDVKAQAFIRQMLSADASARPRAP